MMDDLTKGQRRKLRELGGLAYERELAQELAKLEVEFGRWRAGNMGAFDLSEAIHKFHQGPARDLFSVYATSNLYFAVAAAIHRGLVSRDEAGEDLLNVLAPDLAFLEERETERPHSGAGQSAANVDPHR